LLETITSMAKGITKLKREVEDLVEEYAESKKKREEEAFNATLYEVPLMRVLKRL